MLLNLLSEVKLHSLYSPDPSSKHDIPDDRLKHFVRKRSQDLQKGISHVVFFIFGVAKQIVVGNIGWLEFEFGFFKSQCNYLFTLGFDSVHVTVGIPQLR